MSVFPEVDEDYRDPYGVCLACGVTGDRPHLDTCVREVMLQFRQDEEQIDKVFSRGGSFFQDVPQTPPAVWGSGSEVLWAEGEALMIAGPQGVGKTTLVQQIIRARIGLQPDVLGYQVAQGARVLYLAMDRPSQAQRAGARLFGKDDPAHLNDRLVVWKGPPPFDLAKNTDILAAMCKRAKADTVIVDSLKDAAIGLTDDVVGGGYNRARQKALAEGIQVAELHHQRKAGANGGAPSTISDVYGSVWLTSGAGSVVLLWGEPGDPVVQMKHLKQPMDEIGPLNLVHDHTTGLTTVQHGTDLFDLLRRAGGNGITIDQAAVSMFDVRTPTAAQKEKARRKLNKMCDEGRAMRVEGTRGGSPTIYHLGVNGWPQDES